MRPLILYGGAAVLAALVTLAVSQAPLGSAAFYAVAGVAAVVYGLIVRRLLFEAPPVAFDRTLTLALLFAVLFRVPLAIPRVHPDNDMVRYMYDGRVQRLGINPFTIIPNEPRVAWTHTPETRQMPSIRARTPYPAAAQLFFRLVVTIRESSRAMKIALVACDLLTIAVLVAWLVETRRSPWLALLYAWNPLVILEVAHSGHIDALGALWIAVSAWMLSTGRSMRATIAFVLAFATKLLPIVLVPLYWRRIRWRDAIVGAGVLGLLYWPFADAGTVALGNVPNVIQGIRFNGPVFRGATALAGPTGAAAVAVLVGLAVAAWMRLRTSASDPAAWGWPMAVSLVAAPVIYPWYLLYSTPFLFTRRMLPLIAWTYSILIAYLVWYVMAYRKPWKVPVWAMCVEYGVVVLVAIATLALQHRAPSTRTEHRAPSTRTEHRAPSTEHRQ